MDEPCKRGLRNDESNCNFHGYTSIERESAILPPRQPAPTQIKVIGLDLHTNSCSVVDPVQQEPYLVLGQVLLNRNPLPFPMTKIVEYEYASRNQQRKEMRHLVLG